MDRYSSPLIHTSLETTGMNAEGLTLGIFWNEMGYQCMI